MRAVLSTEIRVERVAVFAEMAFIERRPELGLVARAAQASGYLTPAAVQAALPGLTDPGARNVVGWFRTLGLCDRQGGLTRLGEDVAATNEAPVPEQGVYDLWLAEHPLLGRRILAIERLASTRDQRFELIAPLPITPDRGVPFRSVVERGTRYVLRDLPTNHGQHGCLVRDARSTCRLRWTLDFDGQANQWQLDGFIGAERRPIHHEHERDELDVWRLAETWGSGPLAAFGYWLANERRLAVPLKTLSDREQDSFRMTRTLAEVEVPGQGTWQNVTVEDLPISPLNRHEADRWAHARLDRHITAQPAYRGRGELRRVFAELTEATPLEEHEPVLPAHDAILTDLRDRPALFWSLAAPVDLAVHPVSEEELGPLRIGVPVRVADSPTPELLVQVPYRGGWSMRQLVERLLAETTPRQVLLCDRYVRGPGNLASLELLVRTLRVDRPHLSIEVWTGEQDADIEMIRSLVGQPPRGYRDVFGRNIPHDRYLLVIPATGPGFGWQMSNSPLDVRADVPNPDPTTPLRWRGLVAVRVAGEQLPEPLRRWLTKGDR